MSVDTLRLNVLAYANRFTIWIYKSPDTFEETMKAGYFDDASHIIEEGDAIYIHINSDEGLVVVHGYLAKNNKGKFEIYSFN